MVPGIKTYIFMDSRIRVAVNFENGNSPLIHIAKSQSEDVRDDLIDNFIQNFPDRNNRWAKIVYVGEEQKPGVFGAAGQTLHYHIIPIPKAELEKEMRLMAEYLQYCKDNEVVSG